MQPMKTYRAAVRLPWAKKRLEIGEQFEAPANIGDILVKGGKATEDAETMVAPEVMARASKPVTEVNEGPKQARTYQRRDMVAETQKEEIQGQPSQEEAPRRRGRPAGTGKLSES